MKKLYLMITFLMLSLSLSYAQGIVGQWDFDDPTDLGKATEGDDLEIFGNATVVDGPTDGNGAILLDSGDYLKAVTNATPEGTNTYVNNYTYRIDFKMDELNWNSLLQTDLTNSQDGRVFVTSSGTVGKGQYSAPVVTAGEWYRLIMTVKEDTSGDNLIIKVYVNGEFAVEISGWTVDGGYALRDSVFFLLDDGGEEMPTDVSQIVLYDYALDSTEVAELGDPTNVEKKKMIVGKWDFNDPNYLEKATIGDDLEIFGNATAVDGPTDVNGAILLGNGDYLKAVTNITPRDSNEYVNNYSYRIDIKMDALGWNSLLQTDLTNNRDGRLFVGSSGQVGKGSIGYSSPVIEAGNWYRIIMTVKQNVDSSYQEIMIYVNGSLILNGTPQSIDSYFALRDSVFFLRDDGGEEMPTDVSQIVLYNYALDSTEVKELGTPFQKEEIQDPMPKGEELIANYGFNDGLNGWNFYSENPSYANYTLDNTSVINGPKSVKVTVDTTYAGYPSGRISLNTEVEIVEGEEYYITFKIRSTKVIDGNAIWWCFYDKVETGEYYNGAWGQVTLDKDTTVKYEAYWKADFSDPEAVFSIDFAAIPSDSTIMWLDDIHLIKIKKEEPIVSKSLKFNLGDTRDEYVIVPDTANFGLDSTWTMEAWVNFANFDAPGAENHIMRLGAQLFADDNNKLKVQAGGAYVEGTTALVAGKWYHIAYVRNPREVKVYLDGREEIVAAGADAGAEADRFLLGSYRDPSTDYNFAGIMDEVRLWNVARTKNEIQETKNKELKGDEDNLVIYFDFNGIEGDTVKNRAGEDYNGILGNMDLTNYCSKTPFDSAAIDEPMLPEGTELLVNNYFNDGLDKWDLYKNIQNNADLSLDGSGVLESAHSAKVHINGVGSEDWHIQLRQLEIKGVEEGHEYHIQFMAKASKDVSGISAVIQKNHGNFANLYAKEMSLTADQKLVVIDTFKCAVTDSNIVWAFNLGTASATDVDVWFDAVHVIDLGVQTGVEENGSALPIVFELEQNYPNPFNPSTTINYSLPKASDVQLIVYNILGQKVAELVNNKMAAGNHTVKFNAANLASGVYIYRIKAGSFVSIKKMMLLK
jgi:hypothetical protein